MWIIAEISGHKFYPGQDRHYFDFIEKAEGQTDPVAKARGVAWSGGAESIKRFEKATNQQFGNGIQVLVKVKVEFHRAYGFSLVLHEVDASYTLGNMERQRYETLERLLAENPDAIRKEGDVYLTRNKTLSLRPVIQKIALIGSPNSEGYTDFTHTLTNNNFGYTYSVDIYQSSVQGAGAESELTGKLLYIFNSGIKYDCVVIIRGGGARTDFLVFDTYKLARAVARFPIPVITGLGHHKDVSIVDLMTHTHTKTPTKAAEFIVSHNRQFEDAILHFQKSIVIRTQQRLSAESRLVNAAQRSISNSSRDLSSSHSESLARLRQMLAQASGNRLNTCHRQLTTLLSQLATRPLIMVAHKRSELGNYTLGLKGSAEKYLIRNQSSLSYISSLVKTMSPENVLKKGFAIISHQGRIIGNAENVRTGDELIIRMEHDELKTLVQDKTLIDGKGNDL